MPPGKKKQTQPVDLKNGPKTTQLADFTSNLSGHY